MRTCAFAAVAHVLEGVTSKWWRFDDESVTAMPEGPIGERADHGVAASSAPSAKKVSAQQTHAASCSHNTSIGTTLYH